MATWAKLRDWFGRQVSKQTATTKQSATLPWWRSYDERHPARGLTLEKLAKLLDGAQAGDLIPQAELGDDMEERDSHLFAELSKRRRALVGLPWHIEPLAGADASEKRAAELAHDLIGAIPDFEDAIFDLADAILKGYSGLEITWEQVGEQWLIQQLTHQPASSFCTDQATRQQLRLYTGTSQDGEELWPFGWIMHRHKAKSGYLARQALTRILAWPYLCKVYGVTDLIDLLEIYGFPLAIGKHPASATMDQQAALKTAVSEISRGYSGIIPTEMSVELVEATKATGDSHLALITWAERAESKAILGATLTSEAGSTGLGSNLARVHQDVAWDLTLSDARQLAGTLTRDLVYPLLAVNLGWMDRRRCPQFVFEVSEVDDITKLADAIPKLVPVLPIPAAWVYQRTGIPQPQPDEPVLQAAQPSMPRAGLRTTAALKAGLTTVAEAEQTAQIARLAEEAGPVMDALLDRVKALADTAPDLPTLQRQLSDLYPALESAQLTEVLTNALVAGVLAGRADVLEGR